MIAHGTGLHPDAAVRRRQLRLITTGLSGAHLTAAVDRWMSCVEQERQEARTAAFPSGTPRLPTGQAHPHTKEK